jgi:hypothetical protein
MPRIIRHIGFLEASVDEAEGKVSAILICGIVIQEVIV